MRDLDFYPLLVVLACACGNADENDTGGSTGVDTLTESSTTGTTDPSTTATTMASTSTTTSTTTTAADTTTEPDEESSDSEPHDECAFTESFDLPDGSPWPSYWTSVGGVAVADVQGGRGRLLPTPSDYAVARVITPLDCTDLEVTFSFELAQPSTQGVGFYVRQNGGYLQQTAPAGEGYSMFVEAFRDPPGIAAWREINGVETRFDPITAAAVDANVVYRARLRVTQQDAASTRIQARFWPESASEPDAWQVERTDGSPSLQGVGGNIALDTYTSMTTGTAADLFFDDIVVTAAQ